MFAAARKKLLKRRQGVKCKLRQAHTFWHTMEVFYTERKSYSVKGFNYSYFRMY